MRAARRIDAPLEVNELACRRGRSGGWRASSSCGMPSAAASCGRRSGVPAVLRIGQMDSTGEEIASGSSLRSVIRGWRSAVRAGCGHLAAGRRHDRPLAGPVPAPAAPTEPSAKPLHQQQAPAQVETRLLLCAATRFARSFTAKTSDGACRNLHRRGTTTSLYAGTPCPIAAA